MHLSCLSAKHIRDYSYFFLQLPKQQSRADLEFLRDLSQRVTLNIVVPGTNTAKNSVSGCPRALDGARGRPIPRPPAAGSIHGSEVPQ